MLYRVIGLMSGSSLDGLDIVFAELEESGGKWGYEIKASTCIGYKEEWQDKLKNAVQLNAYDYLLLDTAFGKFVGEKINQFISDNDLEHKVQLIAFHGHTTFHLPGLAITAQLGDAAAVAAITGINVVSGLRAMDVAFGGQGAPIVPIGEKLLFPEYDYFLNIGGIANCSCNSANGFIAFDICPANSILNRLARQQGKVFDTNGDLAKSGKVNDVLLSQLNELSYYQYPYPKSLANSFGAEVVFPLIQSHQLSTADALCTYTAHIAGQVAAAFRSQLTVSGAKLLVTGGGAFNGFLIEQIMDKLQPLNYEVVLPDKNLVEYKEALVMALLGVLRWREENTVMNSVTGASRSSIGGAVWIGQEA